jgi:hypothetical protein
VVVFEPLRDLAPHADAVYRVHMRGRRPGQGRLLIEVRADQLARPVLAETATRVREDPLRAAAVPQTGH